VRRATFLVVSLWCVSSWAAESRVGDTVPEAPERRERERDARLKLSLGGTYAAGNVDNVALRGKLDAFWRVAAGHELFVDGSGIYSAFGGAAVLDRQRGALLYAWAAHDNINLFAYTTHARNRFLELDYRTSNSLGVCWHGFLPDVFGVLLVSIGVTPEYEMWQGSDNELELRGTLRLDFDLALNEYAKVGLDVTFTPVFADPGDFRVFGDAFVEVKVSEKMFSLRLAFLDEYDSRPRSGVERNDFAIVPELVIEIGS